MRAVVVCLALSAGPAMAQDTPTSDMRLTEACLAAAQDDHAKRACVGVAAEACIATPDGESNVGMSWCLGSEGDWWEERRADVAGRLADAAEATDTANREVGSSAPAVAPRAKAADVAWAAWRDAECAVEEGFWSGGSGTGTAVAACRMTLTAERALRLERLVADYGTR
jgi:hypothetical protein